ncbi:MAG: transposase [Oscillospiraceae bacterium]|nr:transposase [Oscillospiraceae bacterium]
MLCYFKSRLTNAICEGINSLIQAAKRKARKAVFQTHLHRM